MNKLAELLQRRAALHEQASALLAAAAAEGRGLTVDEKAAHDKMVQDIQDMTELKLRMEASEAMEAELRRERDFVRQEPKPPQVKTDVAEVRRQAYVAYLRGGVQGVRDWAVEHRGVEVTDLVKGGYLSPPPEFATALLKNVDDLLWMRRLCTVINIGQAQSYGAVSLDTDMADADWTPEIGAVSEDTALRFGRRELTPHQLTKLQKVSLKAVQNPAFDIEAFIRERLAYKFALTMERCFLTGTGQQQPLGLFTADPQGIPTSRDMSTGNSTTAMTYVGLVNAKYTLKQQYRSNAVWLFHRDGVAQLMKMLDGDSRPLWQPSVVAGQPDRFLNLPVYESEWVPNTFTTGLYVGMVFDPRFYWIADSSALQVQRLDELYAVNSQVGFIGRMWSDGMPVLPEAFVRVKLA